MREMGKAMMGTGEASGDKRALTAAAAAIATLDRRFLDEGAARRPSDLDHRRQGPDAVRGRRSRNPDSRGGSIRTPISSSGATFDDKPRRRHSRLGGRHRHRTGADLPHHGAAPVSVATPIASAASSGPDSRLAELTARLRADNARMAERARSSKVSNATQPASLPRPTASAPRSRRSPPLFQPKRLRPSPRRCSRRLMATSRCVRSRRSRRFSPIRK